MPDTAIDPPQDEWQSQHSATLPDWHTHHYSGQTLRHAHVGGRWEHGYYGHAEDRQSPRPVDHRAAELKFRRRVWREAGTAMEQAARLLLVAVIQEQHPEVMEITLTGEYDGELYLRITGVKGDVVEVDVDEFVESLEAESSIPVHEALLDMVAGSGEDYLGEHTIDITEEGKYA